jgi:hypothetical protein
MLRSLQSCLFDYAYGCGSGWVEDYQDVGNITVVKTGVVSAQSPWI